MPFSVRHFRERSFQGCPFHVQLFAEYRVSIEHLNELRGHRSLLDVDKRILENNLYGVDINHEAVEICRLSLWIKTAHPGRQLTSLDLARQATGLARDRYRLHETVRHRILADLGTGSVTLNQKLTAWWDLDLGSFRTEVKKALKTNIPVAERSEWERALADWQRQHTALTESLTACERQINDRVYRLFCLSASDIRFLDDHARHAMIDYPYGQP